MIVIALLLSNIFYLVLKVKHLKLSANLDGSFQGGSGKWSLVWCVRGESGDKMGPEKLCTKKATKNISVWIAAMLNAQCIRGDASHRREDLCPLKTVKNLRQRTVGRARSCTCCGWRSSSPPSSSSSPPSSNATPSFSGSYKYVEMLDVGITKGVDFAVTFERFL